MGDVFIVFCPDGSEMVVWMGSKGSGGVYVIGIHSGLLKFVSVRSLPAYIFIGGRSPRLFL